MVRRMFPAVLLALSLTLSAGAQQVVATIPLSETPAGVALNPFKNRVYVAVANFSLRTFALTVIDGKTNSVVTTVPLLTGARLVAVDVIRDKVYVAGCTFGHVPVRCGLSVVDGHTNTLLTTIPISTNAGIGVQGLAVNPFIERICVSDADALLVDVINGDTNKIVHTISFGGQQPLGLAVDPFRNRLFAALNAPLIAVINGRTNQIIARVSVGPEATNIAVNPRRQRAYVTSETFTNTPLSVVDTEDLQLSNTIPVGNNPFDVAVDVVSGVVFVTNLNDHTISVISGKRNQVVATVAVFGRFIDVDPVTRLAYASDDISNAIHVISEPRREDCGDDHSESEDECDF